MANTSGYKSLDRLGKDPRVSSIYKDADGIWVELAPGYQNGYDPGCHAIHEDGIADVLRVAQSIQNCYCMSCQSHADYPHGKF